MVVRVDINTGEQTVIEPINDKDREGLGNLLMELYYQHEKKIQSSKSVNS